MIYCKLYKKRCMGFLCSADNNEDKTKCSHAIIKGSKENKLRVKADFSSSGIWNGSGGMVDYKCLCLDDKELIDEFERWIHYYDESFKKDYTSLKEGKSEKLNLWGRELARKLKNKMVNVGTGEWEIIFQGEDESGLLKPEIIE